jgi:hypothetical protein
MECEVLIINSQEDISTKLKKCNIRIYVTITINLGLKTGLNFRKTKALPGSMYVNKTWTLRRRDDWK